MRPTANIIMRRRAYTQHYSSTDVQFDAIQIFSRWTSSPPWHPFTFLDQNLDQTLWRRRWKCTCTCSEILSNAGGTFHKLQMSGGYNTECSGFSASWSPGTLLLKVRPWFIRIKSSCTLQRVSMCDLSCSMQTAPSAPSGVHFG